MKALFKRVGDGIGDNENVFLPFQSAMDPDYKALHEGFMSGHTGTTAQEILGVSAFLPLTLGIYGVGIVAFGSTQRSYIT